MKAITIRVKEDFRMKLKIYAASKNKTMKEVIVAAVISMIEEDNVKKEYSDAK